METISLYFGAWTFQVNPSAILQNLPTHHGLSLVHHLSFPLNFRFSYSQILDLLQECPSILNASFETLYTLTVRDSDNDRNSSLDSDCIFLPLNAHPNTTNLLSFLNQHDTPADHWYCHYAKDWHHMYWTVTCPRYFTKASRKCSSEKSYLYQTPLFGCEGHLVKLLPYLLLPLWVITVTSA